MSQGNGIDGKSFNETRKKSPLRMLADIQYFMGHVLFLKVGIHFL